MAQPRSSRSTIGDPLDRDLSDARRRAERHSEEAQRSRSRRRLSWEDEESSTGRDSGTERDQNRDRDRRGDNKSRTKHRHHRSSGDKEESSTSDKQLEKRSKMAKLGIAGAVGFGLGYLVATVRSKWEITTNELREEAERRQIEEEQEELRRRKSSKHRGRRRRRAGSDHEHEYEYEFTRDRDRSYDRRREESLCSRRKLEYPSICEERHYEERIPVYTGDDKFYKLRRPSETAVNRGWKDLDDERPFKYSRFS